LPSGEGVRVRVRSAGICGSDLHLLAWNLPVTMGHEFAGLLEDGRPVAVEPIARCGTCRQCLDGDYNRCAAGPATVLGVGQDGGMADECLVPESSLAPLPAGVAVGDACLVEPLAVAVHGARRGRVGPTDRVAVVGGGTMGQTAVVAVQAAGATVALDARHDRQREAGERLGAVAIDGDYDVVVEAAGTPSALARSVGLCRSGGRVVLLGTYWDGDTTMPALAMTAGEIDLIPCYMYSRAGPARDVDVAAAILARRPEVADVLITHRFPLDAAAEAFATARDRAAGAIKVVLEP
jgi:threonine dehydrogenase-like Zn-dependent dehydrogenase